MEQMTTLTTKPCDDMVIELSEKDILLLNAKAKFFDLQRVIELQQAETQKFIAMRLELVKQIEALESESNPMTVEEVQEAQHEEPITA